MKPLKGKQLLEKLRQKIDDPSYASLDELNEAQEWIALQAPYNWLRQTSITNIAVVSGTVGYTLNLANIRRILAIYIAEAEVSDGGDIEDITLSDTSNVSIQISSHGLSTGDQVTPVGVLGAVELNSNTYTITKTDADNFTLDGTNSSDFTAYVSGGRINIATSTQTQWELMEEMPPEAFEAKVKEYSYSSNSVDWKYRLEGTNPFGKIYITPTPDSTMSIRVDYIKIPNEIELEAYHEVPVAYQQALINLAAGYVLERAQDQNKVLLGMKYIQRAERYFKSLSNDSQANRTRSIDKPKQAWLK